MDCHRFFFGLEKFLKYISYINVYYNKNARFEFVLYAVCHDEDFAFPDELEIK